MKRTVSLFFLLLFTLVLQAQHLHLVDSNRVNDSLVAKLIFKTNYPESTTPKSYYEIRFENLSGKLLNEVKIDSVPEIFCGKLTSIYFIDRNTGFLIEAGGCYSLMNILMRTTDGGRTWVYTAFDSIQDPGFRLKKEKFMMFNPDTGIIVWNFIGDRFCYSVTNNGGKTWELCSQEFNIWQEIPFIENVMFAPSGQVTVILKNRGFADRKDKNRIVVLQREKNGKKFKRLK